MSRIIQLEVKDNYIENVLSLLDSIKDIMLENIILDTNIQKKEDEFYTKLSITTFEDIWDNEEDAVYDKFLK